VSHPRRLGLILLIGVGLLIGDPGRLQTSPTVGPSAAQAQPNPTATPPPASAANAGKIVWNTGNAGRAGAPSTSESDHANRGSVIGVDDRRVVVPSQNPTADFPFKAIASLEVFWPTSGAACTAFFVGPRLLATAAHCLYDESLGFATSVRVIPYRNGATEPFGAQQASEWGISQEYFQSGDSTLDFGIIRMPDTSLSNQTSWMRFASSNGAGLATNVINIAGYPGEDRTRLYHDSNVVTGLSNLGSNSGFINHTVDTTGGEASASSSAFTPWA
jgi:V8-like Glu-specific endopeptidase